MIKIIIERLESSDEGTFGRLIAPGLTLFTGELPWRDNLTNISCIPEGIYQCKWTMSARFKRMMYQIDVKKRPGIRKHSANFMGDRTLGLKSQLNGCIALGEKLGWMDGQKAILLSSPAIRRFESMMKEQPFILEVKRG